MTMRTSICVFVFFFGLGSVSYAADADGKAPEKPFVPRVDLNGSWQGYSLEWQTEQPDRSYVPERQGLIDLQDQDEIRAYLGLKLTKPVVPK